MNVDIEFNIENGGERSGVVAIGSYVSDAARRLGVRLKTDGNGTGTCDGCVVTVTSGGELLSGPTTRENEILGLERLAKNERLACQARIEREGAIKIHVSPEVAQTAAREQEPPRNLREEFTRLPLNKKFATLVEIEAVALSDTISFIGNLPFAVGSKVVDLLAVFGLRQERATRDARRPVEHQSKTE